MKKKRPSSVEVIKSLSKEELKELGDIFMVEKAEDMQEVKISFDRGQYTIRIPKDFAEAIKIDPDKDKFNFSLLTRTTDPNKKSLTGYLIKANLIKEDLEDEKTKEAN